MRDRIFVSISAPFCGAEVDTIFQAALYSAGDSPPAANGAARLVCAIREDQRGFSKTARK